MIPDNKTAFCYAANPGFVTRLYAIGGAGAAMLLALWGTVGSLHGSF